MTTSRPPSRVHVSPRRATPAHDAIAPAAAQAPLASEPKPTAVTAGRWMPRPSANSFFWILVAASALWFGYVANGVAAQGIAVDWWLVLEFAFLPLLGAAGVWRYGVANGWRQDRSALDPLRWTREHQVALLAACLLGAIVGVAYAFSGTASRTSSSKPGAYFWGWLLLPRFLLALGAAGNRCRRADSLRDATPAVARYVTPASSRWIAAQRAPLLPALQRARMPHLLLSVQADDLRMGAP